MSADRFFSTPGGLRLCYRIDGPETGEPLLLIAGLGLQLTDWPMELVAGLVDSGFRVIRLDNRDVGRSARIPIAPPSLRRQVVRRFRPEQYTLHDMADDTVALLDHLDVAQAHLVGMSMGGMIAQTIAARHPERALTLTSIFSSTGNARVGYHTQHDDSNTTTKHTVHA